MRNRILLTPIFGILLFVVMYIVATTLYPGGSQADVQSIGFSWKDNYWCNLFNKTAINGEVNPARPVAVIAMLALAASLQASWLMVAFLITKDKLLRSVITASSLASTVFISSLAASTLHDLIVNLASLTGLIVVICTMIILYKLRWNRLFYFGLINILLVAVNNYVYYSDELIVWLPVIQKITFLFFLSWVCCINWCIYRKEQRVALSA